MRTLALIAYQQAGLNAAAMAGEKLPEIYEVFPLWEEAEVRRMKLERIRRIMERHAGAMHNAQ